MKVFSYVQLYTGGFIIMISTLVHYILKQNIHITIKYFATLITNEPILSVVADDGGHSN